MATEEGPKLVLRTYRPTDREVVNYLFYSTYFSLVPEGVRRKLMAPMTWIVGIAMYAYLLAIVPILTSGYPDWTRIALRVFVTVAWALVGFAALFLMTDRYETVERVEAVRQNDLLDPETYYLNYVKYERIVADEQHEGRRVTFDKDAKPATEFVRELKPEQERTPSHFWVLLADNLPCGIVGLACNKETVYDARYPGKKVVFAEPQPPKTAALQRLAVKYEYQQCGLSNVLITRAMTWANEHGIETVTAVTNEMQTTAAKILKDKHGFKRSKRVRKGWFGQYEEHWTCDVKTWIANQTSK